MKSSRGLAVAAMVVGIFGVAGCGAGTTSTSIPAAGSNAGGSGGSVTGATPTPGPVTTYTPAPGGSTTTGTSGGPLPGPSILYEGPAVAPQLVNTGIWLAPPILESGASSYRDGEYVYQDFLYDDHGANGTVPDANQTDETQAGVLSRFEGTYTYPTAAKYASNSADLVEFRMKPTSDATAFRIALNTMLDPTLYAFTIALGGSTTSYAMPHGANAKEPADIFVTVHGTTGDIISEPSGTVVGSATVSVDQAHRQVTVLVPYSVYDTRSSTALRVAVAVGLWNNATGAYLLPSLTSSATAGGGSGTLTSPPAFYNVGFRHAEPSLGANEAGLSNQTTYWREYAQATALATGDLSSFSDSVDMTKLAAGTNDDMNGQPQGVPLTGHINRVLQSHFEPFQGRVFTGCSGSSTYCAAEYGSALQPYSVYVPVEAAPPGGYPLTLLLHSLTVNYNQFANTTYEKEFGERNGGSLVFSTEDRGPDNWYYSLGEADTFEVWADVARHYPINQNSVALTGYSMGGYATWKLGVLFPDLFGAMQPTVGPTFVGTDALGTGGATDAKNMFASLRNIPILSWHASADELVQTPFAVEEEQSMANNNLNFEWDLFSPADHLVLTLNDQFAPAAKFLGVPANNVNPPHVSFVRNPSMDSATYGVVADHAYWVSNIVERTTSTTTGTIDVLSKGYGLADPATSGASPVVGTLTGGEVSPVLAYTGFKETYAAPAATAVADTLVITATNIAAATIDPGRAKIDCNAQLQVTTDGPLAITLSGCSGGTQTFVKGRSVGTRRAMPFMKR